jgi:hypothetical protein
MFCREKVNDWMDALHSMNCGGDAGLPAQLHKYMANLQENMAFIWQKPSKNMAFIWHFFHALYTIFLSILPAFAR